VAAPLIDAAGTSHAPAGPEARILSLVPSLTELLVDMGLGARLVGRTRYCIHPADIVRGIPSVGGTKKIKLDRARALAPTHAILNIDENTRELAEALAAFVPHIVVTHPLSPLDNLPLYRLFGGLFGREREVDGLCRAFEAAHTRLIETGRRQPKRAVLYLIWKKPWMTVSRDTYVSRLLAMVNWHTLGHDPETRYPAIEITEALLVRADAVLFSTEPYAFTEADIDDFRAAHPCGDARLALIDGEYCSWYGSRAIRGMDYLRDFAEARLTS